MSMLNSLLYPFGYMSGAAPFKPDPVQVMYHLRDASEELTKEWKDSFSRYSQVNVACGEFFKDRVAADAVILLGNSFGFLDKTIDVTNIFDTQLESKLQYVIEKDKHGELLVGDVIILRVSDDKKEKAQVNGDGDNSVLPYKFVIFAPTARLSEETSNSVNVYLAFRAVILAVKRHNADFSKEQIGSILCPDMGKNSAGKMPATHCAKQMLKAYEVFEKEYQRTRKQDDLKQEQQNMTPDSKAKLVSTPTQTQS